MANYSFSTITASQALAWNASDLISVTEGTAAATTVIFNDNLTVSISVGGRTVTFGAAFNQAPNFGLNPLTYADKSILYVGNAAANTVKLQAPPVIPSGAIYGGAGDDRIEGPGNWLVQGNQGDDYIYLSGGANTVYGGQDNDTITFGNLLAARVGNFGQGNKSNDSIVGSFAADTILGGQGDDTLVGGDGNDFVNGNLGNDVISGTSTLLGEGGDDTITSTANGAATIRGGEGNDQIMLGSGSGGRAAGGFASGDEGNDILQGGTGADTLMGGDGNDLITAGAGFAGIGDVLDGEAGDDQVLAREGANILRGGAGRDTLTGGSGADTLDGGSGIDQLTGGGGADVFVFVDASTTPFVSGMDRITDWGADDKIQLRMAGAGVGYSEATAADYATAESMAITKLATGTAEVIAIQVGADVIVFADGSAANTIFSVVSLVGRGLDDISGGNFL